VSKADNAEWRGAVKEALSTIKSRLDSIDANMKESDNRGRNNENHIEIMNGELGDINKNLEKIAARLDGVEKKLSSGKMSGKDKALVYGAAITAIASVIVASLPYIPH